MDTKNIFISHIHEDDDRLPDLKKLVSNAGMTVRDGSITSDKPNNAKNENYIKQEILKPRVEWASTLVVLISPGTKDSEWVNWEIKIAEKLGKTIIGVFDHGAQGCDIPEALEKYGNAAIVGWQGQRIIDAINGDLTDWDDPETEKPRTPPTQVDRIICQ